MSSRSKYKPDISLDDVRNYADEHARSTGYAATITIEFVPALRTEAKATVSLRPLGAGMQAAPVVQRSGPLPLRQTARQMSCLLLVLAQAYEELEMNPWLWAPEVRRRVRGEDV